MKKITLLFVALVCALSLPAQEIAQQLDNLVQQYVENQYFAGSVLVAKGDKILFEKAYGDADSDKRIANQMDTRFNICSMGKMFTSTMVLQLAEQGKVKLNDPINTYLPDYHIPNGDKITIHHLLTHSSGLTSYMEHPEYVGKLLELTSLDKVMTLVTDLPLAFQTPGERFVYSNSGFIVLGKLIEKITGKAYWQNLDERILKPLGMEHTWSKFPVQLTPPQEAIPYYKFTAAKTVSAAHEEWPAFSDGGVYANARDIYRFGLAMHQNKLLKPETKERLLHPEMARPVSFYAYGFEIKPGFEQEIAGHGGGGKGFSGDLRFTTKDGFIVVVLSNRFIWLDPMVDNLLRVLYNESTEQVRQLDLFFLVEQIEQNGIESVTADVNGLLKANGYGELRSPMMLARVCNMLATIGRSEDVLPLLEANAKIFANRPEPFNAIAETYSERNDMEKAKQYFEKALEVNPNDDYAKMRLQQLTKNN